MMIEPDETSFRAVDKFLFADTTEVLANTVIVDKEVKQQWRIKPLPQSVLRKGKGHYSTVRCTSSMMFSSAEMICSYGPVRHPRIKMASLPRMPWGSLG